VRTGLLAIFWQSACAPDGRSTRLTVKRRGIWSAVKANDLKNRLPRKGVGVDWPTPAWVSGCDPFLRDLLLFLVWVWATLPEPSGLRHLNLFLGRTKAAPA
jgi:hypothetical protein